MPSIFEADRKGRLIHVPLLALHAGLDGQHAFWETHGDFIFVDHKRCAVIKSGLIFDGASVPKLIYPLLKCNARDLVMPAIPHDGGYRLDQVLFDRRTNMPWEYDDEDDLRYQWDKIFRKCCALYNIRESDQRKIFYGVRVGGGGSFHQKRTTWRPGDDEIDWSVVPSLSPAADLVPDLEASASPCQQDPECENHSEDHE